ncbi:MAG: STAS domain-containing protein [Spirochaetaceae bacterium]|jgi:anti-anti-sigma factor|nr:STAS domain-containing protein [Spirochaetaceae bacterium]
MEFEVTRKDGGITITVKGKLSAGNADEMQKAVEAAIAESNNIVIDLKDLVFIASAGLRVLVLAQKKLKAAQGKLAIRNVKSEIFEVFKITGLHSILDIS